MMHCAVGLHACYCYCPAAYKSRYRHAPRTWPLATQLRLTRVSCCYLGSSPSWRDMHSGAIHVVRIRGDGREADAAPLLWSIESQ